MQKIIIILSGLFLLSAGYAQKTKKDYDIEKAKYYFDKGSAAQSNKETIQYYNLATKEYPFFANAFFRKGYIYSYSPKQEMAFSAFKSAAQINPNMTKAYTCSAKLNKRLSRHEDSAADYKKALKTKPVTSQDKTAFATAAYMLGDIKTAQRYCSNILRSKIFWPKNPQMRETINTMQLDNICTDPFMMDDALQKKDIPLQKKLALYELKNCFDGSIYSQDIAPHETIDIYLFEALQKEESPAQSAKAYAKAARLYNKKGDIMNSDYFLAMSKYTNHDYKGALEILNQLIENFKVPSHVIFLRALTFYYQNEYQEALNDLNTLKPNTIVLSWKIPVKKALNDQTYIQDQKKLKQLKDKQKYGL